MVFVWDLRDSKPVKSLSGPKISGDSIDFKNNKILIGSYSQQTPLSIWDFRKMEQVYEIKPYHNNDSLEFSAYGAQFSSEQNKLAVFASSSHPNCVRVFEKKNSQLEDYFHSWSIEGFEKGVYSMHVSDNNRYLAIGSSDMKVSVVNINNFE